VSDFIEDLLYVKKTAAQFFLASRLSLILLIILWRCCAVVVVMEAELVWRDWHVEWYCFFCSAQE
jgi:hypothetical protein